jgi:lysozyme
VNLDRLKADLEADEGRKSTLYRDSLGVETFGVGHNAYKALSDRAIDQILEDDINEAVADLDRNIPWWRSLSESRQLALANMCFQLGYPRLARFKKMMAALEAGDYAEAAKEANDSLWAIQTPKRARRIISMIREG